VLSYFRREPLIRPSTGERAIDSKTGKPVSRPSRFDIRVEAIRMSEPVESILAPTREQRTHARAYLLQTLLLHRYRVMPMEEHADLVRYAETLHERAHSLGG
jgi:hypothetical protein